MQTGREVDAPVGGVVLDGVVEQVGDHALDEDGIAGGWRGIERCSYLDAASRGVLLAGDENAFRDLGEVEGRT